MKNIVMDVNMYTTCDLGSDHLPILLHLEEVNITVTHAQSAKHAGGITHRHFC